MTEILEFGGTSTCLEGILILFTVSEKWGKQKEYMLDFFHPWEAQWQVKRHITAKACFA